MKNLLHFGFDPTIFSMAEKMQRLRLHTEPRTDYYATLGLLRHAYLLLYNNYPYVLL